MDLKRREPSVTIPMPWWELHPEIAKFSIIKELTITPRELGRGSYGIVYAAYHSGKPCVAKQMHPFLKHDKLEIFVREINILSTLKHPSIVQFLGVYFEDKSQTPILVMERMWKNLHSLLEEQPDQLFLLTKAHILYDVACGLQYLHSQKKPVVHRDLHPSNILLNENLKAKITDFGDAKSLNNELAKKLTSVPGNIFYMAPETLKKNPTYDTKLDVFSIGCTIIHLVTEKRPVPTDQFVESQSLEGCFQKVSEVNRRIEFLSLMNDTPVLRHIAYQSLEDAPANRPTASYICDELKKYIHQLESEAPELAKQHNKDKFALLQLLQSQEKQLQRKGKLIEDINKDKNTLNDFIAKKEEYVSSLELQYQNCKSKLEENEFTILALNRDKESLQQKLTDLDRINKDPTANYKNKEDLLREDLKKKQEEIKAANENKTQMHNEIEVSQKLATTYRNQVDQLREEIKTKQDEIKHLAIKNEALMLKLSESETEIINLKDQVKIKQEELNKGTRKIEILEQAVSSSANNEVHIQCMYTCISYSNTYILKLKNKTLILKL